MDSEVSTVQACAWSLTQSRAVGQVQVDLHGDRRTFRRRLKTLFGSLAAITTPIVIGYLVESQGSFELALVYVGVSALLAVFCYLVIVGQIKRLDIDELEAEAV